MTRGDKRRLQRLEDTSARYRALAEQTDNERLRGRYIRGAKRLDRVPRWQRIYPMSVWLWGGAVVLVLLPWSLLTRYAHEGGWGVLASVFTAVGLYAIRRRYLKRAGL
jgi:hypothetical protein